MYRERVTDTVFSEAVVMAHAPSYLPVCEGWRAASCEPEDHLQRSPARAAPSPGRPKAMCRTHTQDEGEESGKRRAAYIVNIMYTAFLLVVLFERVVAVKFPEER